LTAPAAWTDEEGVSIPPVQRDPVRDSLPRDAVSSGDLTALYAAQTPDGRLRVCGKLVGPVARELTYGMRFKALSGGGVQAFQARTGKTERGWGTAQSAGKNFCAEAPLASLGNPWAVFVSVESLGIENSVIDQTGGRCC